MVPTPMAASTRIAFFTGARLVAGALMVGTIAAGCGGSSPSTPTPPPTTQNPNVITISSSGVVSPRELTVAPGSRVLFVNNDARRHDMTSDDHPDHQDCPALNQVGLLTPGQSRESGNLVAVRTCGFHDHEDPDNPNLRGRVVVR
jgi:plastocyanin